MAASQQLAEMQTAHAHRAADTQRAAEMAQRFTGWSVWSSREGKTRIATRRGKPKYPTNDGVWAATLIADDWDDLERQLAEQASNDAASTRRTRS